MSALKQAEKIWPKHKIVVPMSFLRTNGAIMVQPDCDHQIIVLIEGRDKDKLISMLPASLEAKKLRIALRKHTAAVKKSLAALDRIMKNPASNDRGQQVAKVCNALEMANDSVRHFTLGESLTRKKGKGTKCSERS